MAVLGWSNASRHRCCLHVSTARRGRASSRGPISPPHLCRAVFPVAVGATPLGKSRDRSWGQRSSVGAALHGDADHRLEKAPNLEHPPGPLLTVGMMNRMRTFAEVETPAVACIGRQPTAGRGGRRAPWLARRPAIGQRCTVAPPTDHADPRPQRQAVSRVDRRRRRQADRPDRIRRASHYCHGGQPWWVWHPGVDPGNYPRYGRT